MSKQFLRVSALAATCLLGIGFALAADRTAPCGRDARPCGDMPRAGKNAPADTMQASTAGIAHESVGIGEDDPVAKMSEHYNLHMVFATQGSGEYLADIKVIVEDSKGKKVLEAESPGPVFYAKLPSGTYRITATYGATSLRKTVAVKDRRLRDLYFHWRSEDITADKGKP